MFKRLLKYSSVVIFIIFLIVIFYFLMLYQKKVDTKDIDRTGISRLTEQQALSVVKKLPEVKNYTNKPESESFKRFVKAEERDEKYWVVQVGETVKDGTSNSHTATMNWYKLDKNSGKILCSMFDYTKEGKLVEQKK